MSFDIFLYFDEDCRAAIEFYAKPLDVDDAEELTRWG